MRPRQQPKFEDPVQAAAELLGDRWTFLILREAFFGTQRFNVFAENLGLSRTILTNRLKALVEKGVFELRPYGPGGTRQEYHLAEAGRDIFPIVVALLQWGDKHLASRPERSIILKHTLCGQDADPQFLCSSCGEPVGLGNVIPTPGPGATEWVKRRVTPLAIDGPPEPAEE